MNTNRPFLLCPAAKEYLWGGTRLNDEFNLGLDAYPLAEAWVCSSHPDGQSIAGGVPLSEVLAAHPEWLGSHPLSVTGGQAELPILIKLIDAKEDLSVQVHPDDEFALTNEKCLGKTEMWYVLSARPGAQLVYGFREDMTPERIRCIVKNGHIGQYLNYVPIHRDDVFLIEAGTVHALGAGCLIAEIQENSNLTYRLYDYDRMDKDGNKRPLQLEKAMQVARLSGSTVPRQPMRVLKYHGGCASEFLMRCRYFQVERLMLNTEGRKLARFQAGENSFHALLCVEGCGVLYGDKVMLPFFKGDCIFVPANSIEMKLHGRAQLLNVSC